MLFYFQEDFGDGEVIKAFFGDGKGILYADASPFWII